MDIVEGRAVGEFPPLIAVFVLGVNCQHGYHLAVTRDEIFPSSGSGKVGFSMIKPCSSSPQSEASNFHCASDFPRSSKVTRFVIRSAAGKSGEARERALETSTFLDLSRFWWWYGQASQRGRSVPGRMSPTARKRHKSSAEQSYTR